MTVNVGGLFSGIGGMELAFRRAGHRIAWMCEIDPAARRVLADRFPGVPVYRDVTELDPADVEPVDVLTGGSPCQGFSVAGSRTGMEHGESRLFADYIRILDGLPGLSWALWENVPGVLSISNDNGERTFPHVVAALVGTDQPVQLRPDARWNTGMAARGRRAVSWRVVNSRHFGVPQRRRRVYACVALGDPREAGRRAVDALLAKPEGVRRCAQKGTNPREGTPPAPVGSVEDGGISGELGTRNREDELDRHGAYIAKALTASMQRYDAGVETLVAFDARQWGAGCGDQAGTLYTDGHSIAFAQNQQGAVRTTSLYFPAMTAGGGRPGSGYPAVMSVRQGRGNSRVDDHTGAITAAGPPDAIDRIVRRLTPTECERLQGFPDGWTEPAGSDTARYRALGNAVTVPVVHWIARRITRSQAQTPQEAP